MTPCRTLACNNQAEEGSPYCSECRPKYERAETKAKDALEAAQRRLDKAEEEEEEVNAISKEIEDSKWGTLTELDKACAHEPDKTTGAPCVLRRRYNNAVRERRQARSDLDRERNAERMQRERHAEVMRAAGRLGWAGGPRGRR